MFFGDGRFFFLTLTNKSLLQEFIISSLERNSGSLWDGASSVRLSVRPFTNIWNFSESTHTILMKLWHNLQHPVCTKVCSWHYKKIPKNLAQSRSPGVNPKISICFLLQNYTQFHWNLITTFITRDIPKVFHTIKNNLASKGIYRGWVAPRNR